MKTYFHKIHYYEHLKPIDRLILPLLWICSVFYGLITAVRTFLYEKKLIRSKRLNAFVISIGNLTTGGTGKTPVTCEIANFISSSLNKKVAIISRGYGGELSNKNTNIISDGENIFYNSQEAGDEPFWIAKNAVSSAVITGKSRIKSGQYAIDNFKSDVLILDDGFQHIKLQRNLNIVLIDLHKVFGNSFLLPAGPLRESIKQLKRADSVVIVNKKPFEENAKTKYQELSEEISKKHKINCLYCELKPDKIYDLRTNTEVFPTKAFAFAGIGQPEFFFNSLKQKNIELVSEKIFEDHHIYTKQEIENITKSAHEKGCEFIVTTEKDAVKLNFLEDINPDIKICALKLGVELDLMKLFKSYKS
jgi:tetraacyldisaccharide 4'-kinase